MTIQFTPGRSNSAAAVTVHNVNSRLGSFRRKLAPVLKIASDHFVVTQLIVLADRLGAPAERRP